MNDNIEKGLSLRRVEIGDNNPPTDAELLAAKLAKDHAALIDRKAAHELARGKLPREVKSDEDVVAINAWVVTARSIAREAEAERTDANKPLLETQRATNAFFYAVRDDLKASADSIEARSGPYLRAKAAEARRKAELEAERLREEARARQRKIDEERAAEEAARRRIEEAEEKIAQAKTQAEYDEQAAVIRQASAAEGIARDRQGFAQADAAKLHKAADRQEKVADGTAATLSRSSGGGGAARVVKEWKWRSVDEVALRQSLGPLVRYLAPGVVDAALDRAAKATPQPEIPGVAFYEVDAVKTTATRS